MELPTYTSIWRIEKRLYKLYDFRLPMPVPVGQIAVFAAITVPYIVLLTIFGLPFNHNLFWLYVLPPGLLTWLATRPVLESKRLPELILSQARYLGEPRTWCRMKPLAENDEILVFGRVWRRARIAGEILEPVAEQPAIAPAVAAQTRQPIAAPSAQRESQRGGSQRSCRRAGGRGRSPGRRAPDPRVPVPRSSVPGPGSSAPGPRSRRWGTRRPRGMRRQPGTRRLSGIRSGLRGCPHGNRERPHGNRERPHGNRRCRWRPPRPPGNDGGPDASPRAARRR